MKQRPITLRTPTRTPRHIGAALGITALAVFPSAASAAPEPSPPTVVTREAANVSVSADGGTAVYSADAESGDAIVLLAATTADGADDDPTPLVSVADGVRGGDTVLPVISGDGCVVVAISQVAFDLFRDDDRQGRWDVYRLVLPSCGGRDGAWELVSTDDKGVATDSVSNVVRPSVSTTGSTVAYTTVDRSGRSSVHVVDLTEPITAERTRTVPEPDGEPSEPYRYRGADQPALSGDGSRLAFRSDFDPTGDSPVWNPGPLRGGDAAAQIYVWDLDDEGGIDLVSARDDKPATSGARQPTISADGSAIAFVANDPGLDPTVGWICNPHCADQVLVSHRSGGWSSPLVASASPLPAPVQNGPDGGATTGDRRSWRPRLSADGTRIAFLSQATNLATSGSLRSSHPLAGDLLIADAATDSDPDEPRSPAPPIPVDPASPRTSDHTGFAMSASFATTVFDVVKVSGGRIVGATAGRTIVAMSTEATLTMADLNFGTVRDDLESDELFTSLRNDGPVGFTPTSVEIDSERFEVTGGSCTTEAVVSPGGACTVYATFTPSGDEPSVAVLTVEGAEGQRVTATVAGRAGAPGLRIEPSGTDFGSEEVGSTSDPETVTVVNYGFEPVKISGVALSGADVDDVSIASDGCTGVAVEAEGSCELSISFTPRAVGDRWATLQVESSDGPATAATIVGSGYRSATVTIADPDGADTLTVDGSGFEADQPVVVGVVGQHITRRIVTDEDGEFRLTDISAGPGPDVTITAVAADGTLAYDRATISVEPSTPTFLPGYGVG